MPRSRRILFVALGSPLDPDRGSSLRDRELILRVARQHEVKVLTVLEPGKRLGADPLLEEHCEILVPVVVDGRARAVGRRAQRHVARGRPLASLPWVTDRLLDRVRAAAVDGACDIVQIEHSFLAPCVESLPTSCRSVLSLHNVGTYQYLSIAAAATSVRERAIWRSKASLLRRLECSFLPRFDGIVAVSEDERRLAAQLRPGLPVTVVPQGVDLVRHRRLVKDGLPGTLLFVGNLAYPPNAAAVIQFCRLVLPRLRERIPNAQLLVVGPEPPPKVRELARDPAVQVIGRVQQLEPWYRRAQVVVIPLEAGGGVRLKALEAMAFGRCVVSTPLGVEGLAVADGREVLLAEPGLPFAERVEQALRSVELRVQIAERSRQFVEREHSWDNSAERLLELYSTLGAGAHARSARHQLTSGTS